LDCKSYSTYSEKDADIITEVLRQIRDVLAKDKNLARNVPFVITGKKDQARIQNLADYCLHKETVDLLEQHHNDWLLAPALFDEYIETLAWQAMDPWTQTLSMFLETDLANRADSV
jgi:hypothetical protein